MTSDYQRVMEKLDLIEKIIYIENELSRETKIRINAHLDSKLINVVLEWRQSKLVTASTKGLQRPKEKEVLSRNLSLSDEPMAFIFAANLFVPSPDDGKNKVYIGLIKPITYELTATDKTKIPNYPNLEMLQIGNALADVTGFDLRQAIIQGTFLGETGKFKMKGVCEFEPSVKIRQSDRIAACKIIFLTVEEIKFVNKP